MAKAVMLLPDFKKALQDLIVGSNVEPMLEFVRHVLQVIFPGGGHSPPSWFNALGTAKRTTINALQKEAHLFLAELPDVGKDLAHPEAPTSRFHKFPEPRDQAEKWKQYYVGRLEVWGKKLRTLEIASQAEDEERLIKHGGFNIIPMPGVAKAETDAALEALDAAAEKIRAKFPQVLYGDVFFATHLSAKTAAHYVHGDDTIHLSVRARKRFSDIYTLIHEFGHRFDHKFLHDKDLRLQFWNLSTRKVFEKINYDEKLRQSVAEEIVGIATARKENKPFVMMSPSAERWVKELSFAGHDIKKLMGAYLAGKIDAAKLHAEIKGKQDVAVTTDKLLHGPLAVTPYGGTKPTENFAEAFAHFVLDMQMPQEFVEIFAKLR